MTGALLISYLALWLLVLALAVLVLVLYRQLGELYLGTSEGRARDGLALGAKAPRFTLRDQRNAVTHFPTSASTVLVFGSPHCAPCVSLMPELAKLARSNAELRVLFVSAADYEANRRLAEEHRVEFPILTQDRESVSDDYGVRRTPFAFYIDSSGVVRSKGLVNGMGHLRSLLVRGAGTVVEPPRSEVGPSRGAYGER